MVQIKPYKKMDKIIQLIDKFNKYILLSPIRERVSIKNLLNKKSHYRYLEVIE